MIFVDVIQATFTQEVYPVQESAQILTVCLDVNAGVFMYEREVSITFFTQDGSAIGEL